VVWYSNTYRRYHLDIGATVLAISPESTLNHGMSPGDLIVSFDAGCSVRGTGDWSRYVSNVSSCAHHEMA
jgi:hypothetical protein